MENEKPKLTKEKFAEIQKKFFTIYKKGKYVFRHNNPNFYFNKWKFLSITPVKIRQRKDRKIKLSVLLYYSTISSEYVNPFEHLNLDSKRMSKDLFDKYNRYILLHKIGSIGGKKKKSVEDFKKYATKDIQESYNKEKALKKLFDKIDENNKILVKKSFDEMKKNKNFNDDDDNNVVNNDNNVYENKNKENKIENLNVDVNEKKIDDNNNNNLRNKNVKENKNDKKSFENSKDNFIKTKTNDENSDQNKIPFNDNNNKNLDQNKIEIPTDEFNEIELKKKISLEKPDLNKKEIDEEENYDFDKNKKEIKTSFDNNEKKINNNKKQKTENDYKYKKYFFSDDKKIPSRKDSEIDENKIELFNDLSDGKPIKIEEKDDFDENNDIDENKKELFNDLSDLPPKPFEPVDYNFNFDYFPSYYDYDNNEIKNENEIPEKKEKLRSVIKKNYSKQTENDEENNLNEIDENKKQIDEEENYDIDLNKKEILDNEGAKKKKINYDDYYRNLYNWHYYWHLHNYYHNLYHQHYYYHNYYNNLRKNAKEENPLNPSNKLIDNNDNVNNINSGIINKPVLIEDKNKKDDDKNLKIERENSTVPVVAKKHETHVNKIVENDNNINVKGIINNPIIEESKENIIINKTELELPKEIDKEKQYKGWLFLKILSFVSYEKNNRFAKGFFDTWKENAEIKKKNFEDNRIETKFNH